jgi:hypothetical protein
MEKATNFWIGELLSTGPDRSWIHIRSGGVLYLINVVESASLQLPEKGKNENTSSIMI